MTFSRIRSSVVAVICLPFVIGSTALAQAQNDAQKIRTLTVAPQDVTVTEKYICKIHGHRHIKVRSLEKGYVKSIDVKEGQAVKQGDLLFEIEPADDQAQKDAKAKPFSVKAPFDGMIGRMEVGKGGLVLEGETMSSLSDNSLLWVYFNVPEARYLRFMNQSKKQKEPSKFELVLANGKKFDQPGRLGAIDSQFNPDTGCIAFRADFANPERLLRHGQGGTLLISQLVTDAILIPQRATFERSDKRYVYVVDKSDTAHQREIVVQDELDDKFVIHTGVEAGDTIVVEGIRQLHDGDKIDLVER